MMKPRKLPRLPRTKNENDQTGQNNNVIQNNVPQVNNIKDSAYQDANIDSDFIRKKNKIRERHREDYSILLSPDNEDIVSEDVKLYDNKDINLEAPKIKENIGLDNTEFYIESIHHDQYYKINQIKKEEKKKEEIFGESKKSGVKKRKKATQKKITAYEQAQALENKLFDKFDKELTVVITKTLSKVTLIFLFAQGLLAGMGLLHLLVTISLGKEQFLSQLSKIIIIMFNIFHALTFTSLVGNGIKFVSSYQKYKIISIQINNNLNEFTRLRQNMIFSCVLLIFFTIVFGMEVVLGVYIQRINHYKCADPVPSYIRMSDSQFDTFKYCHIAFDIVVIVLFILNIFDLNIQDNSEDNSKRPINFNFYLGSENNQEANVEVTQT